MGTTAAPTVAVALALVLGAARAAAQGGGDEATRRWLLEQSQVARGAGNHGAALDFLTRAGRIRMTPSVRLYIAQEQNTLGHLAEALGSADLCVREADRDPGLNNRAQILEECRGLVAAIQPRVGRVIVRVPDPPPAGLRVRVAGSPLSDAFYSVPYVVTPGSVRVEADVDDRELIRRDVAVGAGGTVEIAVELPPGVVARGGASARGLGAGPFVLLGAGALGVAASAVFFGLRNGATGQLDRWCDPADAAGVRHCDSSNEARGWFGTAMTYNAVSITALAVGGVALAGGVAWLVASVAAPRAERRPRAQLFVVPVGGGLALGLGGAL